MRPPSNQELIILCFLIIATMSVWLWTIQPHSLHDIILVLASGLTGICGALFFIGLIMRAYK